MVPTLSPSAPYRRQIRANPRFRSVAASLFDVSSFEIDLGEQTTNSPPVDIETTNPGHRAATLRTMPAPEFVIALRRHVGHAPLWLPAVTAVVLRDDDVLLIRRSDTLAWTPITGILDPGEQPAVGAVREVAEETGVLVEVESLAWVRASGLSVHVNGDEAYYLDHLFRCRYVSGTGYVADDECVDVAWFPVADMPQMDSVYLDRITYAVERHPQTRFDPS